MSLLINTWFLFLSRQAKLQFDLLLGYMIYQNVVASFNPSSRLSRSRSTRGKGCIRNGDTDALEKKKKSLGSFSNESICLHHHTKPERCGVDEREIETLEASPSLVSQTALIRVVELFDTFQAESD